MINNLARTLLFLSLALSATQTGIAGVSLLRDIETTPTEASASPAEFVRFGNRVMFIASDPIHGRELWTSDGSNARTNRLIDICSGSCSSNPQLLTVVGDRLFFFADDGSRGQELWVSDGTIEGTTLLLDIRYGPEGCQPQVTGSLNGLLLFWASHDGQGLDLWRSDGSRQGTYPIGRLCRSTWCFLYPPEFISLGDAYYFEAKPELSQPSYPFPGPPPLNVEQDHGVELWATDGSVSGTRMVADIEPGAADSNPHNLIVYDERLCFLAGSLGSSLWCSDGTEQNTVLIHERPGNRYLKNLAVFSDQLALFAVNSYHPPAELWMSDGTSNGTRMITQLVSPAGGPVTYISNSERAAVLDDILYFGASSEDTGGGLWRSDGTAEGTGVLVDLEPGRWSPSPRDLTVSGDALYFTYGPYFGGLLWRTYGSADSTQSVLSPLSGEAMTAAELSVVDGSLWFAGGSVEDLEPSLIEQFTEQPRRVANLALDPGSSRPGELLVVGTELFFSATDSTSGRELWRSNGSRAGTSLVRDLVPGEDSSYPTSMVLFGAQVAFTTHNPYVNGSLGLWVSDGTASGTIKPTSALAYEGVSNPIAIGSQLFFRGETWDTGVELWGGDASQVDLIMDIWPGVFWNGLEEEAYSSTPRWLMPFHGRLLFSAVDESSNYSVPQGHPALWTSDGSAIGTIKLPFFCEDLTVVDGNLFCTASSDSTGSEIWRSQPELDQLTLVRETIPGPDSGHPSLLTSWGNRLLFTAMDEIESFWISDGTASGTLPFFELELAERPMLISEIIPAGPNFYFTAFHESTGLELWISDGTTSGTRMVEDILPGPRGSSPQNLAFVDGVLFFAADDGRRGLEPWSSDGTPAGTFRLADIADGPDASNPNSFNAAGSLIYFSANDGQSGRELWVMPRPRQAPRRPSGRVGSMTQPISPPTTGPRNSP